MRKLLPIILSGVLLLCSSCESHSSIPVPSEEPTAEHQLLSEYPADLFASPIPLVFTNQPLTDIPLNAFEMLPEASISYVITVDPAVAFVTYSISDSDYYCMQIGDALYELSPFPDSTFLGIYNADKANIEADYPIYKYDLVLGANYFERIYFTLKNSVPCVIYTIAFADDYDLDGNGYAETVSSYGLPIYTELYFWDVKNGCIQQSESLNDILECTSVVWLNHQFLAEYCDSDINQRVEVVFTLQDDCLVIVE